MIGYSSFSSLLGAASSGSAGWSHSSVHLQKANLYAVVFFYHVFDQQKTSLPDCMEHGSHLGIDLV